MEKGVIEILDVILKFGDWMDGSRILKIVVKRLIDER